MCFTQCSLTPCLLQHKITLPVNARFDRFHCISMLSTPADTNPGRESTSDLTYCPKKARNMSVFSAWYCFNRVRQPVTKGGASRGSVGFLLTNPPRKTIVYSAKNSDSILRMVGRFATVAKFDH